MSTVIKNISDLKSIIDSKIQKALELTYAEINDTFEYYIGEYYKEYQPKIYERTNKLKNSPIELNVVASKNGYSCSVGFSDEYLNYKYPDKYVDGVIDDVPATGLDVVSWNDYDASHGYTVGGEVRMWSDFIGSLGGRNGIMSTFKRNLKVCGIPLK